MKRTKRILALFLAMAMVLGMSMTTFAAVEPGTITVNNTSAGTKLAYMQIIKPDTSAATGWAFVDGVADAFTTNFTGDMYKTDGEVDEQKIIWSLLVRNDSELSKKAPEWAKDVTAAPAENLQGALQDVMELSVFPTPTDDDEAADFNNGASSVTVIPDSIPSGKTAGDYAGLYAVKAVETGYAYSPMTAFLSLGADGTVGSAIVQNAKKVDVGGENPGDGPFDKTDGAGNVVAIGEKVKYTISTVVPYIPEDIVGNSLKYEITDILTGATYVKTSDAVAVTVKMNGTTVDSNKYTVSMNTGKESFTIDLKDIAADRKNANNSLEIEYFATITDVNAHNKAEADYGTLLDYEGNKITPPSDEDDVFTGSITMTKTGEGGAKLSGAKFRVYFLGTPDKDGIVQPKADGSKYYAEFDTDSNKVKAWVAESDIEDIDDAKYMTQATDNNGNVTVTGLKHNVAYKFEEAVAPNGYSINSADSDVEWTNKIVDGTKLTQSDYEAQLAGTATMEDTTLASLPSTGGIGTTIFTVGGCAIMIIAAGLYFASRRRAAK